MRSPNVFARLIDVLAGTRELIPDGDGWRIVKLNGDGVSHPSPRDPLFTTVELEEAVELLTLGITKVKRTMGAATKSKRRKERETFIAVESIPAKPVDAIRSVCRENATFSRELFDGPNGIEIRWTAPTSPTMPTVTIIVRANGIQSFGSPAHYASARAHWDFEEVTLLAASVMKQLQKGVQADELNFEKTSQ